HFSNHLFAGWKVAIPPSLEICALDLGLLLALCIAWRVARRLASGNGMALAAMSPWAVLAGALYSAGIWVVFQPMQMRGVMLHENHAIKPLLIGALVILAQATAWPDGGTVQLRQEAGDLVITVFTSPS